MEVLLTKYEDGCDYTVDKDGEMLIYDPDWNRHVHEKAPSTLFWHSLITDMESGLHLAQFHKVIPL
jgi:hypothetical protein